MTSADPAFKELSVGSRTQISKQAFALHVVSAMKDKVQGAGGGRCGANSRGCEPSLGSGRAGRGGGRGGGVPEASQSQSWLNCILNIRNQFL